MYSARKSGYVLIQLVIGLGLAVLVLMFATIKEQRNIYDLRDTGDKIATMIRSTHQEYRATRDNSLEIKIQYANGKTKISLVRKLVTIETFEVPDGCSLKWSNSDDTELSGNKNSYGVSLKFRDEGVYSTADSKKGMTMYLTDEKSKKFIKLTIVPTSGRVYMYDGT